MRELNQIEVENALLRGFERAVEPLDQGTVGVLRYGDLATAAAKELLRTCEVRHRE